tara:strand:+ start:458 stop:778 length:321 start_codon:yes stop_codon:yes gene_type:complete
MQKYLSIYLTTPAARSYFSATNVSGVDMPTVGTIKIWYHDGGSCTLTLSDNMAANDNTGVNYIMGLIATAQGQSWTNVTTEVSTPLGGGTVDAAGAAVTIASAAIA